MQLVWLDIETTGLDPHDDAVLEVAMRLSDRPELDMRAFSRIVRYDGRELSTFIREMPREERPIASVSSRSANHAREGRSRRRELA